MTRIRILPEFGDSLWVELVEAGELHAASEAIAAQIEELGRIRDLLDADSRIFTMPVSKGTGPSTRAIEQWAMSRTALCRALARVDQSARRIGTSLSHAEDAAAAAVRVAEGPPGAARVGIDVERAGRPVSQRVLDRIAHPEDQTSSLSPIEIWIVKEAVLKASLAKKPLLREAQILEKGHALFRDEPFRFEVAQVGEHIVACAIFEGSR